MRMRGLLSDGFRGLAGYLRRAVRGVWAVRQSERTSAGAIKRMIISFGPRVGPFPAIWPGSSAEGQPRMLQMIANTQNICARTGKSQKNEQYNP
jgi:hypothetical protein